MRCLTKLLLVQVIRGRSSRKERSKIKLLALDMDGTLLDSTSQVLPSSVEALKAALKLGVTVCLATGKARPAAMTAMQKVGLAGVSFPPAFYICPPTDRNG